MNKECNLLKPEMILTIEKKEGICKQLQIFDLGACVANVKVKIWTFDHLKIICNSWCCPNH